MVPSEEGGTEFADIDAGGFDDGEGETDVSQQVDKENLEPGSGRSENRGDQSKDERAEDQAIEMEDDFDGVMENVPNDDEEGRRCVWLPWR